MSFTFFASCDKDENDDEKNIVATAQDTDNLSTLVSALERAGLTSTLNGAGPFTVLAPNNTAFQKLLDSNSAWNSINDIDVNLLTDVLLFHVMNGEVKAADLTTSYVNTLSKGPNDEAVSLRINTTDGVVFNGAAKPLTTDVETTNGIVHIIDEVMVPPGIVGIAATNDDFSILVSALTRSDLNTDYLSVLNGEGPFTVFAPTNGAFEALLAGNDEWNALADIPVETLEAVLNYHVVSGANVQSDELTNNQVVATLGGNVTIDTSDGVAIKTSSDQTVKVAVADVQGVNGVVHAIGTVLLP